MTESKRITISVRVNVLLEVDAQRVDGGDIEVVKVMRINGLPSDVEVMEALDADGDFAQLDTAWDEV